MRNGLLTTALFVAGVTFMVAPVATAQQNSGTLLPPGARLADEIDRDDITETLGEVTEAAMTVGGFNDLVERLVDADRNRIGDYTGRDLTTLNGRIRQLRKLWE